MDTMTEWIYQESLMNNESDYFLERSKIISMSGLECDEDDRKENEESQGESEGESPKGDHETPKPPTPAKPTPKSKTGKSRKKCKKRSINAVDLEGGDNEHGDGDEVGEDQQESGLPPLPDADDDLPAMDLSGLGLEEADGGLPTPTPAKRSRN